VITRLVLDGENDPGYGLPGSSIRTTLRLPCLEDLHIDFEKEGPAFVSPLLESQRLTYIWLQGGSATSVRSSLPYSVLALVVSASCL